MLLDEGGQTALAESQLTELVRGVLESVAAPLALAGRELQISCSIGLAAYPHDGDEAEILIKHADTAMYRAKREHTGYAFFDAEA